MVEIGLDILLTYPTSLVTQSLHSWTLRRLGPRLHVCPSKSYWWAVHRLMQTSCLSMFPLSSRSSIARDSSRLCHWDNVERYISFLVEMTGTASVAPSASTSTSTVKPPASKSQTPSLHKYRIAEHARIQAPGLPARPSSSYGIWSKLLDMLPISRYALFLAQVTIHQLWGIPFVQGSFCVRWKFQNVLSANSAKLKMKQVVRNFDGKEKENWV